MGKKSKILYNSVRVITLILFAFNIFKIIISRDFSLTSEYVFIAFNAAMLFSLTYVPIVLKKFNLIVPNFLLIIFLIFVTASQLLGEIGGFFRTVTWWDDLLHFSSGGLIALVSVSLINILNKDNTKTFKLSPIFVVIFAFCFAMAVGVIWEIVEFTIDGIFQSNMQRYKDSLNYEEWTGRKALFDTMLDFILNTSGALLISVITYFDLKKESKLVKRTQIKIVDANEIKVYKQNEEKENKILDEDDKKVNNNKKVNK